MATIEEEQRICSYCGGAPYPTAEAFSHHWSRCPTRIRAGYIEVPLDMIPAELERLQREVAELEERRTRLLEEAAELQARLNAASDKESETAPSALAIAQAAEKPPQEPMYLVLLQGDGTVLAKLVPVNVWHWIHLPYSGKAAAYDEPVPEVVIKDAQRYGRLDNLRKGKLKVTRSRFDNDRARAAPGLEFRDIDDARAYAKTNKVPIVATYEGSLY
jgi:hypothetical protein